MRPYDPKPPQHVPWHDLTEPQQQRETAAACHTRPGKKPGCSCNNCATIPPPKPEPERLNRYALATEHTNAIAYTDYYKKVCARNFKNFHPRWAEYATRLDPDLRPDLMKDLIFVLYAHGYGPNSIHASLADLIQTAEGSRYPLTMLADIIVNIYTEIIKAQNKTSGPPQEDKYEVEDRIKKGFGQI